MDGKILASIVKYLRISKPAFKNGILRFSSTDGIMKITYYSNQSGIEISENLIGSKMKIYRQIQDFALDCFFDFEWGGEEISSKKLSIILGMSEGVARVCVHNIYEKMKKYEKQLLSQK